MDLCEDGVARRGRLFLEFRTPDPQCLVAEIEAAGGVVERGVGEDVMSHMTEVD